MGLKASGSDEGSAGAGVAGHDWFGGIGGIGGIDGIGEVGVRGVDNTVEVGGGNELGVALVDW